MSRPFFLRDHTSVTNIDNSSYLPGNKMPGNVEMLNYWLVNITFEIYPLFYLVKYAMIKSGKGILFFCPSPEDEFCFSCTSHDFSLSRVLKSLYTLAIEASYAVKQLLTLSHLRSEKVHVHILDYPRDHGEKSFSRHIDLFCPVARSIIIIDLA